MPAWKVGGRRGLREQPCGDRQQHGSARRETRAANWELGASFNASFRGQGRPVSSCMPMPVSLPGGF